MMDRRMFGIVVANFMTALAGGCVALLLFVRFVKVECNVTNTKDDSRIETIRPKDKDI